MDQRDADNFTQFEKESTWEEMGEAIVPALNKEEVDELYALFDKYDDDGNGELELEELAKMMNNLGTKFCALRLFSNEIHISYHCNYWDDVCMWPRLQFVPPIDYVFNSRIDGILSDPWADFLTFMILA